MAYRLALEVSVAGAVTSVVVYSGETAGDVVQRALHNTLGPDHSTDLNKCELRLAGEPIAPSAKIESLDLRDGSMMVLALLAT